MTKVSLYVRLEAKPGKEQEVADFLVSALPLVNQEPETTAWFALRMSSNTFGIFGRLSERTRPRRASDWRGCQGAHGESFGLVCQGAGNS